MRNLFKFLPVALISLFVLGACTVPADQTGKVVTPGQQTQTQQQEGAPSDMPGDQMMARYGANLNCDMLKDANNKQNCKMQLNEVVGAMLESEIYSAFDVSRCKELGGQMAGNCETRLNEMGVKGPVSAEELALFNEVMRGTPSEEPGAGPFGGMTYDSKKCEGLKTEGFSAYCVKMVGQRMDQMKFEEVISSGDVKRCDEFTDVNRQNECKMFFGVEVMPVEPVVEPVVEEEAVTEEAADAAAAEQEATLEITEAVDAAEGEAADATEGEPATAEGEAVSG